MTITVKDFFSIQAFWPYCTWPVSMPYQADRHSGSCTVDGKLKIPVMQALKNPFRENDMPPPCLIEQRTIAVQQHEFQFIPSAAGQQYKQRTVNRLHQPITGSLLLSSLPMFIWKYTE